MVIPVLPDSHVCYPEVALEISIGDQMIERVREGGLRDGTGHYPDAALGDVLFIGWLVALFG